MGLPIICPECQIHNPTEARWCECGFDLEKVPAARRTISTESTGTTANIAVSRPQSALALYIGRHLRGELSLPESYWINTILIGFVGQLLFKVFPSGDLADLWMTSAPAFFALCFIALLVSCYTL